MLSVHNQNVLILDDCLVVDGQSEVPLDAIDNIRKYVRIDCGFCCRDKHTFRQMDGRLSMMVMLTGCGRGGEERMSKS